MIRLVSLEDDNTHPNHPNNYNQLISSDINSTNSSLIDRSVKPHSNSELLMKNKYPKIKLLSLR